MTQSEPFEQLPQPWSPHGFQKKAVKFLLEHAAAALFMDPGMGKTSATYAALKILKAKGVLKKALIIAPLRPCYLVWPKERAKWADFMGLRISILHGPKKAAALAEDVDAHVINPEGLEWLLGMEKSKTPMGKTRVSLDVAKFKALGYDTLIVDELTMFKHTNTVRFKALRQILPTFARRWGLTGSPAANGLMDLFGQCYVLDEGRSLGQYITHYRLKYFDLLRDGFTYVLKPGAEKDIYDRIRPLALRMAAEDYLDLPDLVENDILVDLPEDARVVYDHLENDLLVALGEGVVTAANAGVASMKCRQVAGGGIYLDQDVLGLVKKPVTGRAWADVHKAKTEALQDLVEELQGSPLLVAYEFEHDLERIKAALGQDTPHIGGGTTARRSTELEAAWNRGELPVLLAQPQSIGHGLNLQACGHHICWYTLTWNYELYDQFNKRVHRQGNKNRKVFVHKIKARGTIDQIVDMALRGKAKGQQALFEALKTLRRR
jgi:SNF2 family DNA or RNA helicase